LLDLLLGRIAGSMGVTSVLAILIGGFYLIITKTANRWIVLALVLTYGIANGILSALAVEPVPSMLLALTGGGFLFGAFFMATDPISAPKLLPSKIIYGVIIGLSTLVIRNFSVFNGGLMFSVLLGNMFAPILDYYFKNRINKK
jgi:Na+-transporting NADH:ubiquinone oxidoreductase subunit B